MVTVSLLNRWTGKLEVVQSGERRNLDSIDDYRIRITFTSEDGETKIVLNDNTLIRQQENSLDLPILVDAEGYCSVRISQNGGMVIGRYKFKVPLRTLLDEAMVTALHFFADRARELSPSLSTEELLRLPFFSPRAIRNSLMDEEVLKLDEAIAQALPSLIKICNKPRRTLMVERRIMPIDRARRIPPDAIDHLASRPELWQSRTATRITPARIRSEVPEETLDLYENRVVSTLIRRLLRWLEQRLREIDRAYYQTETLHENLFTDYQYNRFREQRLRLLWKNLDTVHEQNDLQQYEKSRELKDKISLLSAEISSCLDSVLYKNLSGKPDVVSPLKPTNILRMDADYRRISQLWEILDNFQRSPNLAEESRNQPDIQLNYANYIYGCVLLALRWIGFDSAKAEPENFPQELDFAQALQWEGWTVVVQPPDPKTFNINIDFNWQSVNSKPISSKRSTSSHPTRTRLIVVPVARSLFGNPDEVKKTLDTLYQAGINQASETNQVPKQRKFNNDRMQISVLLVHPTDPRDREMSENIASESIQRMLNIGENFMIPEDYKSFVSTSGRIGMMPASPLDLSTLERFQRFFRFHTLGVDLLCGIHPSFCPVCDYDLSSVRGQFQHNEGKCPNCEAKWSWRTCSNCRGKVPKLEPLKMKPLTPTKGMLSYAVHAMAREQLLGRDQLSALCESNEVPESGRIRDICPHCGTCPGRGETVKNCPRCGNGCFGQD